MKKVVLFLFCFLFLNAVNAKSVILTDIDCIDGDTFRAKIDDEEKTIRMIGIDTPETKYATKTEDEPYAKEASDYTCNHLKDAKDITLEYDPKSKKEDKYGRSLGWIFIDDKLLQKELVSLGYAKVEYVYDDYLYIDELYKAEDKAKDKKIGIWSEEDNNKKDDKIVDDKDKEDDDSIFDKIVDYIWDKIKLLFKNIYNNIKKYIKNILKEKFNKIFG